MASTRTRRLAANVVALGNVAGHLPLPTVTPLVPIPQTTQPACVSHEVLKDLIKNVNVDYVRVETSQDTGIGAKNANTLAHQLSETDLSLFKGSAKLEVQPVSLTLVPMQIANVAGVGKENIPSAVPSMTVHVAVPVTDTSTVKAPTKNKKQVKSGSKAAVVELQEPASEKRLSVILGQLRELLVASVCGASHAPVLQQIATEVGKLRSANALAEVDSELLQSVLQAMDQLVRLAVDRNPRTTKSAAVKKAKTDESVAPGASDAPQPSADTAPAQDDIALADGLQAALVTFCIFNTKNVPTILCTSDRLEALVQLIVVGLKDRLLPLLEGAEAQTDFDELENAPKARKSRGNRKKADIGQDAAVLLPRICTLLEALEEFAARQRIDDSLLLSVTAPALHSFMLQSDTVHTLQLSSMALLTTVFTKYPRHRQLILMDTFSNMMKLPPASMKAGKTYRLYDEGKFIHVLSALLLRLFQCSTVLPNAVTSHDAADCDVLDDVVSGDGQNAAFGSYESVLASASQFMNSCLLKCLSAKADESDAEGIMSTLINDLFITLPLPEWPAAQPLLQGLIISCLQALRANTERERKDQASLRLFAMKTLGDIAQPLRGVILAAANLSIFQPVRKAAGEDVVMCICGKGDDGRLMLDCDSCHNWYHGECVGIHDNRHVPTTWFCDPCIIRHQIKAALPKSAEAPSQPSVPADAEDAAEKLVVRSDDEEKVLLQFVLNYLSNRVTGDSSAVHSRHFFLSQWLHSGPSLRDYVVSQWDCPANPTSAAGAAPSSGPAGLVCLSRDGTAKVVRYLAARTLAKHFDAILGAIVTTLRDANTPPGLRTRAMRSLTRLIEVDSSILARETVRLAVEERVHDDSKQVREATIDLVGKYARSSPKLTAQYFGIISKRILDKGKKVRERVVRVLVDICVNQPDSPFLPEISQLLIARMTDAEESIKRLVAHSLESMWFQKADASKLESRTLQVVQVLANPRNHSWFISLLQRILTEQQEKQQAETLRICEAIVSAIVARLQALEQTRAGLPVAELKRYRDETTKVIEFLRTVSVFSKIRGKFAGAHASNLAYYLISRTGANAAKATDLDAVVVQLAAEAIAHGLPAVEHPNADLVQSIEDSLVRLINTQGVLTMAQCVECLASVVSRVSHHTQLVCDLVSKHAESLEKTIKSQKVDVASVARSGFTLGTICRFCDVEKLMPGQPAKIHVLFRNLFSRKDAPLQAAALTYMCPLFVGYPRLVLQAHDVLSHSLGSAATSLRVNALQIIHDLLQSQDPDAPQSIVEHEAEALPSSKVDLGGVLTQYFASVVKLLEDADEPVRKAALQTTTLALKLGLIHPLTCVNQLLVLLVDRQPAIANKAFSLITTIMDKTPECVWSRLAPAISASYYFQRTLWKDARSVVWEGDDKPGESLFGRLFALSKKQRAATRALRFSFLASAIKLFDVPTSSPVDIGLMRYIVDALGYLSFTNIEEPLCLIYHINRLLALKGEPVMAAIKNAKDSETNPSLANHAGAVTLLILLKNFLKQSYALTESRCKSYMPSTSSATSSVAAADLPPLTKAEKEKEKEIQANPELRRKAAAIPSLPAEPKALIELFRKTMKADTSDTLAIAAQPTGKAVRKKAAKRAAAADGDEADEAPAPKKSKKKPTGGKRGRSRTGGSESEHSDGEAAIANDDEEFEP